MRKGCRFFLLFISISIAISSGAQVIKVTLLGTGVPLPSIDRFGPATLVEANNRFFLFDCGRGVSQRLWQQKIGLGKINNLFLTHLHSDHTVGIADLWLTGLLPTGFGNRSQPLQVWGPAGTTEMVNGLNAAYQWDVRTRNAENNTADSLSLLVPHTVTEGIVFNQDGIRITAFLVNHSDLIDSAFGYRVDYGGHSVVLSGDTRYSENLVSHAKGADVLIHEVALVREELLQTSATARRILSYHTSPEEAGTVFSLTKPRLAVYSHIATPLINPAIPSPTTEDILLRTKKTYQGRLEVGEDLMTIEISDTISVKRLDKGNR